MTITMLIFNLLRQHARPSVKIISFHSGASPAVVMAPIISKLSNVVAYVSAHNIFKNYDYNLKKQGERH